MALSIRLKAALFTVMILILPACSESLERAKDSGPDRIADESAIRSLLTSNWAASSRRDLDGVVATFAEDGDAWITGQELMSGHDALRSGEDEFTSIQGFQRYEGEFKSIRFISRDAAIVEVAGTTVLEDGQLNEETTIIVVRRGEDWRIAAWRVINFDGQALFQDTESDDIGEPAP